MNTSVGDKRDDCVELIFQGDVIEGPRFIPVEQCEWNPNVKMASIQMHGWTTKLWHCL